MTTQQKPAPAVGQIWKGSGYKYTVAEQVGDKWRLHFCMGAAPSRSLYTAAQITCDTYLGPLPGKAGEEWAVGQRRRGDIADLNVRGVEYVVTKPHTHSTEYQWRVEVKTGDEAGNDYGVCEHWPSELLASHPTGGVPAGQCCERDCEGAGGVACTMGKAVSRRVAPQGLSQHEYRNINGVAMSALEFIQARKPPQPWRPSVDDFDLLPDAGTAYRTPSGGAR